MFVALSYSGECKYNVKNIKNKKVLWGALFVVAMLVLVTNMDILWSFAMSLTAGGTNDNLYLNPSGNGRVVIGGDSIVVASRSSDPTTNRSGQIYFNSSLNEFRGYDGTAWRSLVFKAGNTHSVDLESGSSQYLSISDANQTGLKMSGSFTMEMWVKFESVPTTTSFALAGKSDQNLGSNFGYITFIHNNSGTLRFLTYLAPSAGGGTAYGRDWTPATDTWYHIAITWDAPGTTLRYYVDGSQVGSDITTAESSLYTGGTAPFTIGMNGDGTSNPFDGLIDDVRVFNRALSAGEIAANFNKELDGNESGLVGYWRLNNSLLDETSGNNDLTNNNSATFSTNIPF